MRTRSIFTLLPVLISCASSPYTEEIDEPLIVAVKKGKFIFQSEKDLS